MPQKNILSITALLFAAAALFLAHTVEKQADRSVWWSLSLIDPSDTSAGFAIENYTAAEDFHYTAAEDDTVFSEGDIFVPRQERITVSLDALVQGKDITITVLHGGEMRSIEKRGRSQSPTDDHR